MRGLNLGVSESMKRLSFMLPLALVAADGVAQSPSSLVDAILGEERAIATEVESRTHIRNFDLQQKPPEIQINAGGNLSFYDMGTGNVVHEELWENVPAPMQAIFNQWAAKTSDESSGRQLFQDLFHRFFFVHELGHWMQDQVLEQRRDKNASKARLGSKSARWQYETVANRISIAWWRERDPGYLAKLVNDIRTIEASLPNPVPAGEEPRHYFTSQYAKLAEDPNAYGWFQLQMVILAYDERPLRSYQRTIAKLPTEDYRD